MAEDVNFPLDQARNTSAFQGLREVSQETTRPRRVEEEQQEELNDPEQTEEAQEQQPVNEVASLESRVELSQEARQQAGEDPQNLTDQQNQEPQQEDIAIAERREFQTNRQGILEDATAEFRNPGSQGPAGANELSRISEGFVQDSDELLNDQIRSGNDIADPDRIEEFENGAQIDSVQEAIVQAGEDAVGVEEEDPGRPLEGAPSIRDLAREGSGVPQGREALDEGQRADLPTPEERSEELLEQSRSATADTRVQERLQEERRVEEERAAREEPAIDTPEQEIEPVEGEPESPIQEGLDINPLRGPRPSELRDEDSDASAVETERGQNISNLI